MSIRVAGQSRKEIYHDGDKARAVFEPTPNIIASIMDRYNIRPDQSVRGVLVDHRAFIGSPHDETITSKTRTLEIPNPSDREGRPAPTYPVYEIGSTQEEYPLPHYLSKGKILAKQTGRNSYDAAVVFDDPALPPIKIVDARRGHVDDDFQPALTIQTALIAATVPDDLLKSVRDEGKKVCIVSNINGYGNDAYVEPHIVLSNIGGEVVATVLPLELLDENANKNFLEGKARSEADTIWFVLPSILFEEDSA